MARSGGGRRTGGGGFGQNLPTGRVRTARGGTRNRGGGLVDVSVAGRRTRRAAKVAQQTSGLGGGSQTIIAGGGGRGGAIVKRGSGADNARSSGTSRKSNSRFRKARPAEFSQRGVRKASINAMRRLAREGTGGEKAAAAAAAKRLRIKL